MAVLREGLDQHWNCTVENYEKKLLGLLCKYGIVVNGSWKVN